VRSAPVASQFIHCCPCCVMLKRPLCVPQWVDRGEGGEFRAVRTEVGGHTGVNDSATRFDRDFELICYTDNVEVRMHTL